MNHEIAKTLLDVLVTVKSLLPKTVTPMTTISKAMLDSGVRQGLFLAALDRKDSPIDIMEPLPLMGRPIYVNLKVTDEKDGPYISGSISCFDYIIEISPIRWDLKYSVEEFLTNLEFKRSEVRFPVIPRPS
jgi:hypothetical protein